MAFLEDVGVLIFLLGRPSFRGQEHVLFVLVASIDSFLKCYVAPILVSKQHYDFFDLAFVTLQAFANLDDSVD